MWKMEHIHGVAPRKASRFLKNDCDEEKLLDLGFSAALTGKFSTTVDGMMASWESTVWGFVEYSCGGSCGGICRLKTGIRRYSGGFYAFRMGLVRTFGWLVLTGSVI